jgi:hypothetical protein
MNKIRFRDVMPMWGCFTLRVYRRGELIEEYKERNIIVNGARRAAALLIAGAGSGKHIAKIAFGTSGNIPTPDDTEITSPFIKSISEVTYPSDGVAEFHWKLLASEANGKAILEFGLICEDGTLWARKVRTEAIPKEADIALEGEWQINH